MKDITQNETMLKNFAYVLDRITGTCPNNWGMGRRCYEDTCMICWQIEVSNALKNIQDESGDSIE